MDPVPQTLHLQTLHLHPSIPSCSSWLSDLFPLSDGSHIIDAPTPLLMHSPRVMLLAWQGAVDNSLDICDLPSVLETVRALALSVILGLGIWQV